MPELGKTATEVISVIEPLLREMVSKEEYAQQTREIGRMADQLTKLNGTTRALSEWRAGVDERHRQEDAKPREYPPAVLDSKMDALGIISLVLGWAWKFMVAGGILALGLNAGKLLELWPK